MIAKYIRDNKILLSIVGLILVVIIAIGVDQIQSLQKAHSTFNNYYAFRGCTQLVAKTPTYGICKTGAGQTIKIVLYKGKWYLNGDLPTSVLGHLM